MLTVLTNSSHSKRAVWFQTPVWWIGTLVTCALIVKGSLKTGSRSLHACSSVEFVVGWPLISMCDQCSVSAHSLPQVLDESLWWGLQLRGPILAEWCILGAGAPWQGPPSLYYGHHLQRLCRLSSSVVILPRTNKKTDCCALRCTLLISEKKTPLYLILHKVHDVFKVQIIVVVHDAFSDIFVQQLQCLRKKEVEQRCQLC